MLLTHPGTQHARHLAKQLALNGLLYRFHTGIAFGDGSWQTAVIGLLPSSVKKKLSNRTAAGIRGNLIKSHTLNEIKALRALKKGGKAESVLFERNQDFQNGITDKEILNADLVIGFDTSSWILAQRCKALNKPFILDVSIAHPDEKLEVYKQILAQYPKWSFALEQKSTDLIDLELKEFELADKIVVASTFCKDSLIKHGVSAGKIHVNPYGTDLSLFKPTAKENELVKFVFVGLVDARKGIPVLLDAWKKIKPGSATLTLIGPIKKETEQLIINIAPDIIVKNRVAYSDLPILLSEQDVLVFPSYFEGYGLVIPEAMASGLTVITTPATCGPDVIDEGINGFIVPCGDVETLADRMQQFIKNKSLLATMQQNAAEKIRDYTWDAYGKRWANILSIT